MKNTKRFMALLLALVLVFSSMTTAFAADVNEDVIDTTYETAVTKLNAVGIMEGYPDGTFRPEGQITRAEFAKIAVLSLGLNDAAEVSKSNTIFTDVDAMHWAAGYINVAVDRGILKGYPDGSYKPSNPLTNAEAITILTRLIGLGPVVDKDGNWPANYITQANILGLMNGVAVSSSTNATRGNAAKMLVNTLTVQKWGATGYNNDGTVQYGQLEFSNGVEKSLLNDNLDIRDLTGDYSVRVTDYDLELNEITTTASNGTFELLERTGADFYDLFLNEVDLWVNSDDEVIFAEIVSEYYIDAVEFKDDGKEVKLSGLDKTFKLQSQDLSLDGEKFELAKVVLNDRGRVIEYDLYTDMDMTVVDFTEDDVVTALDGEEFDFDGYAVFKDGKFASVEDMEKGDVLFFAADQDGQEEKVVEIYNKSVTGEITDVFDEAFDVEGKEYKYADTTVGNGVAQYLNEDEDFDNMDKDAAEKFEDADEDVAIFFDRFGKLVYVTGDLGETNTDTVAGILLSDVRFDSSFNRISAEFEFVNEEGTKVVERLTLESLDKIDGEDVDTVTLDTSGAYDVATINFDTTPATNATMGADASEDLNVTAGRIVEFVYDDDGSVVELNFLGDISANGTDITKDKFIGVNRLSSSTVVFMIKEGETAPFAKGDITVVTVGDADFDTVITGRAYVSDLKVSYIATTETNAEEDTTEVIAYVESVRTTNGTKITRATAWVDGGKTTYTVDEQTYATLTAGTVAKADRIVTLKVRDDDSLVTDIDVANVVGVTASSVDISAARITATNGTTYRLTSNAVIIDASGSVKEVKLRDIKDGYELAINVASGVYVDYVAIIKK
jgi:hypothetical protein